MGEIYKRLKQNIFSNYLVAFSLIVVIFIFAVAIFAPQIAPYDPLKQDYVSILKPPSLEHPFGTDELGRDLLSRVIYGTRISLLVSLTSVFIGAAVGILFGLTSGYFGGKFDFIAQRLIDFLLSFPGILLALLISTMLGSGLLPVIVAIAIWSVPTFCRITRSSVLSVRESEYVMAAKSLGAGTPRIIVRHIFQNILGPLLVYGTLRIGSAILTTAYLSFLGVGVLPPSSECGLLLNQGRPYINEASYYIAFPGLAIFITVLNFNILGDGLRDLFDVKQS